MSGVCVLLNCWGVRAVGEPWGSGAVGEPWGFRSSGGALGVRSSRCWAGGAGNKQVLRGRCSDSIGGLLRTACTEQGMTHMKTVAPWPFDLNT